MAPFDKVDGDRKNVYTLAMQKQESALGLTLVESTETMKQDRQNWQLKGPLALEGLAQRLPPSYGLEEVANRQASLALLDDFNWSLWQAGLLLLRENKERLVLQRQADDQPLAACSAHPDSRFWWQLPEGELVAAIQDLLDVRAFVPKYEFRVQRQQLAVLNPDQKTVVRLQLEEIAAPEGPPKAFLEARPLRGYRSDFRVVAGALTDLELQPLSQPGLRTRLLETGLVVDIPQSKPRFELDEAEPAETAVTRMAVKMLQLARQQEPGMIADIDSEFVHQYRVNIRKTRSLISLFRKCFDHSRYRLLKTELKELGSRTNELRDLDVFLLDHDYYRELLPEHLWPGLELLFRRIKRRRRTACRRVAAALTSDAYLEQISSLLRELEQPAQLSGKQSPQPIKALAGKKIRKQYRAIQEDGTTIDAETPDAAVHELRIECKKLRYLLELFAELFPPKELKPLVKKLKQLQDNLGRFNDFSVQQEFLQQFARGTRSAAQLASLNGLAAVLHNQQRHERSLLVDNIAAFIDPAVAGRVHNLCADSDRKDDRP
jgi:CHAD domain-containing protein